MSPMLGVVSRNWRFPLRGVIAIPFGIVAIVWPDSTLITLVWLFGFYATIVGFRIRALDPAWR